MFFPEGSINSSNRHKFFRRVYRADMFYTTCFLKDGLAVRRTDLIISSNRYYISQKPLFSPRTHTNFPRASIFSSNRYQFSKGLFSHQTDIHFPGSLTLVLEHILFSMPRTDRHFLGRYPLLNRYFVI